MGYSIDSATGRHAAVTGDKLRRQEPDGSTAVHAEQRANEIVVDARGNIYLNGADFDFVAGAPPKPGYIKLVTPTAGYARSPTTSSSPTAWSSHPTTERSSSPSRSPAGSARSTSTLDGGLSGCRYSLPKDSARTASASTPKARSGSGTTDYSIVRVTEGGEVLQRVELGENRAPFAMMLGGPDLVEPCST